MTVCIRCVRCGKTTAHGGRTSDHLQGWLLFGVNSGYQLQMCLFVRDKPFSNPNHYLEHELTDTTCALCPECVLNGAEGRIT